MRSNLINLTVGKAQDCLYQEYHKVAKKHSFGFLLGIPVAVLDGALETIRPALKAFESLALVFVTFIQVIVDEDTGKYGSDMIYQGDRFFKNLGYIPYSAIFAPIKILHQALQNMTYSESSVSMHRALHRKCSNPSAKVF